MSLYDKYVWNNISEFEDYCAKHNVEFSAGLETAMIEFMSNHQ